MRRLDRLRIARRGIAPAPRNTRLGGIPLDGVVAVEPVHGHGVIVPHAQHQHHLLQLLAHLGQPANGGEVVVVPEDGLLLRAEGVRDVVDGVDPLDGDDRVGDDFPALYVEALDGAEGSRVGAVVGDELGYDGKGLRGVDCLGGSVEVLGSHAEGVEVAAVLP